MDKDARFERITWTIIKCAMKVHSALGPGLFESVYLACLVFELREAGFQVDVKVKLPLVYRGIRLDCGYEIESSWTSWSSSSSRPSPPSSRFITRSY